MQKNVLDGLSARLRELDNGGYARVYRRADGGEAREEGYSTGAHALVSSILEAAGVKFKTDVLVLPGSSSLRADFAVGNNLMFIRARPTPDERKRLVQNGKKCAFVSESELRSDRFDTGIRVSRELAGSNGTAERRQTIFLDDPSFNFDYAHILPKTEKCSVMHGHTSSALIELIGAPVDGMVVDFNDAKPIIKGAIAGLDHKLFINEKYVVERRRGSVALAFETVHGRFEMKVPTATTVLMDGEATVENLANELLRRIAPKMPENVSAVGVYVYEGLNKGTHLLAQVHSREAELLRRRRTR